MCVLAGCIRDIDFPEEGHLFQHPLRVYACVLSYTPFPSFSMHTFLERYHTLAWEENRGETRPAKEP